MQNLARKTAFVTGAASGIGLGIAQALARQGVRLMLADIQGERLMLAVEALRREGAEVEGRRVDVSLKAELEAAAEAAAARFGKLHILVNNAGVGGGGRYGTWTDVGWDWVIGVNLMSVIWGVQLFAPLIEAHGEGGHIVNTASMAGLFAGAASPYSVTKAGVVALSEGLRRELAPRGIGVSVLCPDPVATRIVDSIDYLPERFRARNGASPMGAPTPEELAAIRRVMADGADPAWVGELVREAIEHDWPYIMTGVALEPPVLARFAAIRAGFDRIRGHAAQPAA